MSFDDKWTLPRLIDFGMRTPEAMRYRSQVVPQAHGVVLEVGVSSGLNLLFYEAGVERIYALDPSVALLNRARKKAHTGKTPVEFLVRSAETIPLDDASVDTVVMTWTLCSIPDPARALAEMRRVLRPHGALLFAEHGLAPDEAVRRWQERLNPVRGRFTSGCNLNRKIDGLIRAGNFTITRIDKAYAKGPRPMSYVYAGAATLADSRANGCG